MTIKQYSVLKEYETQMRTASQSNFVRALGTQSRQKLAVIYKEIFGRESGFIGGCGSCMLKNLRELAVPYFEFQNKLKNKKKKEDINDGEGEG
jgi:hypothetical protein